MRRHRGLALGLALGAFLGTIGGRAHAGPLTLSVDLNGVVIFTATSTGTDQSAVPDLTALNLTLGNFGSAYHFTALSASSNYTGGNTGTMTATGTFDTSGSGTTAQVLSVDVAQSGFLSPIGDGGMIDSTAGGSYTAASGSLSYTSDFQGANTPTLVFPVAGSSPFSADTGELPIGTVPSRYELSSHFLFSLAKNEATSLSFSGTATVSAAVPEPASVALMLAGVPVALTLLRLPRKRRAAGA